MDKDDDKKLERARQRKKRQALSRLRKALTKSKDLPEADEFTEWENDFANSLEQRLETFDSAFIDPDKGRPDAALSYLQAVKLKEIEDKAKGKKRKTWNRGAGFGKKKPKSKKYDPLAKNLPETEIEETNEPQNPVINPPTKPFLRIIKGGKS